MNNNQEPVTQTEKKIEVPVTQTDDKNEKKTFTQEEVNAMILKATNKVNEKYKDIDLKGYNKWKESQKTDAQKHQELLEKLEKEEQKNLILENRQKVIEADVDKKFIKFVTSEVSSLEGDFDENLKEYLKENSQFVKTTETKIVKNVSSSASMQGKKITYEKETNRIMNDAIRSIRER